MALPNPGMDAVPFTPLTAEFLDDMIENIESLSDGTGFESEALDGSVVLQDNSVSTGKVATSAITTPKVKLSTINFLDPGGSNFTTSSTSLVDVTGVTTTYTTGSTNERLYIWFQGMAQVSATASANIIISVNGTNLPDNAWYPTAANEWSNFSKLYIADVPANTTATIKARILVSSGNVTFNRSSPFQASFRGFATSN